MFRRRGVCKSKLGTQHLKWEKGGDHPRLMRRAGECGVRKGDEIQKVETGGGGSTMWSNVSLTKDARKNKHASSGGVIQEHIVTQGRGAVKRERWQVPLTATEGDWNSDIRGGRRPLLGAEKTGEEGERVSDRWEKWLEKGVFFGTEVRGEIDRSGTKGES